MSMLESKYTVKTSSIGEPIEGAANIFCDNEYVYKNSFSEEYQIMKNHQAICVNWERECMANNIIIVHRVNNNDNLADMLFNSLPGWKCVQLRDCIMYSDNPNISWDSS